MVPTCVSEPVGAEMRLRRDGEAAKQDARASDYPLFRHVIGDELVPRPI